MTAIIRQPAPPGIRQGKASHLVAEIILHCSATHPAWMHNATLTEKVEAIRQWHTRPVPDGRGWRDIGYHWVIDRDGALAKGRPMTEIGAHVVGKNAGTIGICLIGGHGSSETDRFLQNFTAEQDQALRRLVQQVKAATPIQRITGHNEYARKACPGFSVADWLRSRL